MDGLLWIPITLAAAALQTARNAFQRGLTGALSPFGATATRFVFGFPFASIWALLVLRIDGNGPLAPGPDFFGWATLGGVAQIAGTACLLRLFQLRNFSAGIAFSKSEVLQVALFGLVVLGDAISVLAAVSIVVATLGLVLLARDSGALDARSALASLAGRPALLGLATGGCYAIAAVGFRAASLSLGLPFVASAAATLATATGIQSVLVLLWLAAREPGQLGALRREWKRSLLPGLAGAAASACWFTAMTIEVAAHVRMLGLVEVLFGYGVSIIGLGERPGPRERLGTLLLVVAILGLLWDRAG